MVKFIYFLSTCYMVIALNSCTHKVAYSTQLLKNKENISEKLIGVQFYAANDILLIPKSINDTSIIKKGKILVQTSQNSNKENAILIKANTPGIIVSKGDEELCVSFEIDNSHYLVFSLETESSKTQSEKLILKSDNGIIKYNNKEYYLSPDYGNAFLLVKKQDRNYSKHTKHFAAGRKVNS